MHQKSKTMTFSKLALQHIFMRHGSNVQKEMALEFRFCCKLFMLHSKDTTRDLVD